MAVVQIFLKIFDVISRKVWLIYQTIIRGYMILKNMKRKGGGKSVSLINLSCFESNIRKAGK